MALDRLIDVEDLVEKLRSYNSNSDGALIRAAYEYCEIMHRGQFRQSGEPYIVHPVEVAYILAEMRLDDQTIVTALLHDTIEDTRSTFEETGRRFGPEVATLVDGVTKLTNLQLSGTDTEQAENFRKLLLAMSRDARVILVKLADRLHNMRTIKHLNGEKQRQKARETMEIFAPLAGRMGMQWMRDELEDLAFSVLNPEGRVSIMRRFLKLQKETGDVVQKITLDIKAELARAGVGAEVVGRAKKPYSIWRKMQEKKLSFARLSDIYGFRILVDGKDDCYRALGAMHQRWIAVPGRFKDYISQPKSNGYRSIHTTVSGRAGRRVEIQIRTRQMHDVAESGVAAHWSYRDGVRAGNPFAVDPTKWISDLTERLTSDSYDEFMEDVKLEMYSDKVFCFTPRGDVVKLPLGATPLDFAYAIHTRIGDRCVGAKIDHERVPLWTRIRNGQMVEIITAEGQRPHAEWESIVKTGRAGSAIRRSLREEERERFVRLGRELVRVAFDHVGKRATEKALSTAARQLGLRDSLELLDGLGRAKISGNEVVRTLYPKLAPRTGNEIDAARAVVGLATGQNFERAQCCQPVPGERIAGIRYSGKGVFVHAIDCPALQEFEDQSSRWVDLHWHSGPHPAVHTVSFDITISNFAGVLGRVCTLIGEQGANISDLRFIDRKPDFYKLIVDVDLSDAEHLHAVVLSLEAESDVASIDRDQDLKRTPRP